MRVAREEWAAKKMWLLRVLIGIGGKEGRREEGESEAAARADGTPAAATRSDERQRESARRGT